ncbi:MAG TPA: hypothetical protein VGK23_08665 [Methanomassiliicoccales archaeon]
MRLVRRDRWQECKLTGIAKRTREKRGPRCVICGSLLHDDGNCPNCHGDMGTD